MKNLLSLLACLILSVSSLAQTRDYIQLINNHKTQKIESLPDSVLKQLATAYEAVNIHKMALTTFEELYKRDTLNEQSILNLARINTSLGNYNSSIECLYKIYQNDTTNLYLQYQLAEAYIRNGEFENSLKFTEKAKQLDSTNYYVWNLEAQTYQTLNKNDKALKCYTKALELNRPSATLAMRYLTLITKKEMTDTMINNALSVCDSALYYNPNDKRILRIKGQIMFSCNHYQVADSIFRLLLNEQDSSYTTLRYAALSAKVLDDDTKAIELFEKAKQVDSSEVALLFALAETYIKTGDPRSGEMNLAQVQNLLTPNPMIWSRMLILQGDVCKLAYKYDRAIKYYWEAYNISMKTNFTLLSKIYNLYSYKTSDSPEQQGRAIFPIYLLATNHILNGEAPKSLPATKRIFKFFMEDLFLDGVNTVTLIDPNNNRTKVSIEKFKEVLDQLNQIALPISEEKSDQQQ